METPRPSPAAIAATVGGIVLMAALVVAVDPLREAAAAAVRGDSAEVRSSLDSLGAGGPLLILALALLHSFVFFPAEIVDAAAGFLYGFFPALALAMTGWLLSGLICFAIGRSLARPLLDRWFGEERFERIEATIERGGATLLLAMRLIPILPFSLVSYAAGAARVPTWRFIWTTARRLPADHRAGGLLRDQARGPQPHRPDRPRLGRRAAGAAARRPPDRPAPGRYGFSTRKLNAAGVRSTLPSGSLALTCSLCLPCLNLRTSFAEQAR